MDKLCNIKLKAKAKEEHNNKLQQQEGCLREQREQQCRMQRRDILLSNLSSSRRQPIQPITPLKLKPKATMLPWRIPLKVHLLRSCSHSQHMYNSSSSNNHQIMLQQLELDMPFNLSSSNHNQCQVKLPTNSNSKLHQWLLHNNINHRKCTMPTFHLHPLHPWHSNSSNNKEVGDGTI